MKLKEIKLEIRKDGSFERLFDNLLKEYFGKEQYPFSLNIMGFGILKFRNAPELLGRIKMLADIVGIQSVVIGESEETKKTVKLEEL
jgi:hypothetical protein